MRPKTVTVEELVRKHQYSSPPNGAVIREEGPVRRRSPWAPSSPSEPVVRVPTPEDNRAYKELQETVRVLEEIEKNVRFKKKNIEAN